MTIGRDERRQCILDDHSDVPRFQLMFVSRGHGRGHAVPDIAITSDLAARLPWLQFHHVSYADGADVYRAHGIDPIDLKLPANPAFLEALVATARVLKVKAPDLLVAHEEPAALLAAQIFDIPSIFIIDFFMDPSAPFMRALEYAEEVLFTGDPGVFTEPPSLNEKLHYVGRAVRDLGYTLADRSAIRAELNIDPEAIVLVCQPGAWSEARVAIIDLLCSAWKLLPFQTKQLIWVGGRDYEKLSERFHGHTDITVLKEDWKLGRLMAGSNVLITKANRMTVFEAAALGLPSLSLSNYANWPDDVAVAE